MLSLQKMVAYSYKLILIILVIIMYHIQLGVLEHSEQNLDDSMNSCFHIFPEAYFSDWNSTQTESWIDIFEDDTKNNIVGKIFEVE